uniref:Cytochrome b n=1 Tax=Sphyranura euryceae TaxID=2996394 RepID=A0AA51YG68_9PLAT|nr:cytochrome b [Sphyranura euryceae]WMV02082.1 cytochrome b [Sphyranura euryceae]
MFFIRNFSYTNSVPRFDMPTSSNLNLFWCSGSMAGIAMSIQLISGIICSMDYIGFINTELGLTHHLVAGPGPLLDNFSIELLRFMHLWGASLLFVCLFIHMGRGLYYCSYSKNPIMWSLGVVIYVAIMAEAFMGYLLPWHQMSYWAGVVISSIFLSLPLFGPHLYSYLLGSYDFGSSIISRVFVVHVVFGFIILFLIILHLVSLHKIGSSDSFNSSDSYSDSIYFHNLYTRKDLFVWLFVILITLVLTCYNPWLTSCKENFMIPNSLSTPTNIKPEWYFLPFYAILRSIENKIGGLLAVVLVLFLFWLPSPSWMTGFNSSFRRLVFWFISYSFIFLGVLGSMDPTGLCQLMSILSNFILCISLFFLKLYDYLLFLAMDD